MDASPRMTTRDVAWQSRTRAPAAEEIRLALALEAILAQGTHDLDGILAGLDAASVAAPGGGAWTEQAFRAEMSRLGRGG